MISIHSPAYTPTHRYNFYEPEEYQQEVAESRCQTVFRDRADFVPLFTWWTFRDFGDPRYKGVNSKGLETYGGFRKDIFYLFQSFLKPETPVVHLCGKPWFLRRSQSPFDQLSIKAYSNAAALTLTVNGTTIGTAVPNGEYFLPDGTRADNVFSWDSPLKPGRNLVKRGRRRGPFRQRRDLYRKRRGNAGLVQNLTSSNPLNPAYFLEAPIQAEWPFYDDFDGTGDNTFHAIPDILTCRCPLDHHESPREAAAPHRAYLHDRAGRRADRHILDVHSPLSRLPPPAAPTRDAPAKGVPVMPRKPLPPAARRSGPCLPDFLDRLHRHRRYREPGATTSLTWFPTPSTAAPSPPEPSSTSPTPP